MRDAEGFDCDYAVIGSGFGGAVSALRLAEQGHRVLVLEQGRRIGPDEIAEAKTRPSRLLWLPWLGFRGFFWQRVFRHVGIIGGAGVGGGSLVFAGVLVEPRRAFFRDPAWSHLGVDWESELGDHYATAARMLGRATNPALGRMDEHLRATAEAMGVSDTFGPVPLAMHFGAPGQESPDPYFQGEGPTRTACRFCGGCLTGCEYGSKNSLDHNYLHLARRRGAAIRPEHQVTAITPVGDGYELTTRHPWRPWVRRPVLRARQVVLAAGVLGTLELLFRNRDELGTLPHVSPMLGRRVRTNSEAITAVLADDVDAELNVDGPAVSSDFYPDERTHVTQNRMAANQGFMRLMLGPLVDGIDPRRRARRTVARLIARPAATWRLLTARGFVRRLAAFTVMQHEDNELAFRYTRTPIAPWRRGLRSVGVPGRQAPTYLPVANEVARRFADAVGGQPLNMLVESVGNRSVTAHILGGCPMGAGPEDGVIDTDHEVFGHPGLFVVDAAAIGANLGVNPSLTITALAERFASRRPGPATPLGWGTDRRGGSPEGTPTGPST
jgi:cholesterol oxidase